MNDRTLDGNALAGPLGEVFACEITTVSCTCNGCGAVRAIGALRVYADAPGIVARCPGCSAVMLRFARGNGRLWLDMQGIRVLEIQAEGWHEIVDTSPDRGAS